MMFVTSIRERKPEGKYQVAIEALIERKRERVESEGPRNSIKDGRILGVFSRRWWFWNLLMATEETLGGKLVKRILWTRKWNGQASSVIAKSCFGNRGVALIRNEVGGK